MRPVLNVTVESKRGAHRGVRGTRTGAHGTSLTHREALLKIKSDRFAERVKRQARVGHSSQLVNVIEVSA